MSKGLYLRHDGELLLDGFRLAERRCASLGETQLHAVQYPVGEEGSPQPSAGIALGLEPLHRSPRHHDVDEPEHHYRGHYLEQREAGSRESLRVPHG